EFVGEVDRLLDDAHRFDTRMLRSEEDQPRVGTTLGEKRDRSDEAQRVEPAVEAAAPYDDAVFGPDSRNDAAQHVAFVTRRNGVEPEWGERDEPFELGVVLVGRRGDAT